MSDPLSGSSRRIPRGIADSLTTTRMRKRPPAGACGSEALRQARPRLVCPVERALYRKTEASEPATASGFAIAGSPKAGAQVQPDGGAGGRVPEGSPGGRVPGPAVVGVPADHRLDDGRGGRDARRQQQGRQHRAPPAGRTPDRARHQTSRSAVVIFRRAARAAGKKPPTRPIARAKKSPPAISSGVMRKLNRTSEKVRKFIVPVGLVRNRLNTRNVKTTPRTPPARHSRRASITKERRIERREKPIARRVPISRVRLETWAYIVFMAPKAAPMAVKIPTR